MSKPFSFKQFTVTQDKCAMKVGTDGVLLGAWANVEKVHRVLDVGTGSGLIALMLAQRNSDIKIDAIDIDSSACLQAEENFINSPWSDRITLLQQSVFDLPDTKTYDAIVCNPPFFINSTLTPNASRTTARHCIGDFHKLLVSKASKILNNTGTLSLVMPCEEGQALIAYAGENGLHLTHLTQVKPTPTKAPKRLLITLSKQSASCITEELVVELSRHIYSDEFIKLTKEFYLHM
ncbi:MAG: tRNA1(Val) (adenine(37)-N6)-methyltransferase [Marinifilaceae bacterium]